jgi:ribosome-associated heat shock protein Hsp15
VRLRAGTLRDMHDRSPRQGAVDATEATIRFDLWLWAARFYRSRALAVDAIGTGQARLNGERVKQAHAVRAGDRVTVRKAEVEWDVAVTGIAGRRGSAADAATLYRESDASRAVREERAARARDDAASPRHPGRPTKRERRRLEDFLGEP